MGAGLAAYTGRKATKKIQERTGKNKPFGTGSYKNETSIDPADMKSGKEDGRAGDGNDEQADSRDQLLP